MSFFFSSERQSSILMAIFAFIIGCALLLFSFLLIRRHVETIRNIEENALPIASSIPSLERRVQLLKRQLEVSELQASLRSGSPIEQLHVFVVPASPRADRSIAAIDLLLSHLSKDGKTRNMSAINVADAAPVSIGEKTKLTSKTIALSGEMREEGMQSLLRLSNISGLLTVRDAFTDAQLKTFFRLTEEEAPTGLAALSPFLATDLLSYLREPKAIEERLLSSFPSEKFAASFRALLGQSPLLIEGAKLVQGEIGAALLREKLWPLPFMTIENVSMERLSDGWIKFSIILKTYARQEDAQRRS